MSRPARPADPLSGTELLLVDANNLVGALARTAGAPPAAALVARIRNLIPRSVLIELVFDGPVERGMGRARVATGVTVRYSGRQTADETIVGRVRAEAAAGGPLASAAILVISDDRGLRDLVRALGARTAGSSWLASRLGGTRAPWPRRAGGTTGSGRSTTLRADPRTAPGDRGQTVGHGTPPPRPDVADDDTTARWQGGRGATAKRGNPRRAPRRDRPRGSS